MFHCFLVCKHLYVLIFACVFVPQAVNQMQESLQQQVEQVSLLLEHQHNLPSSLIHQATQLQVHMDQILATSLRRYVNIKSKSWHSGPPKCAEWAGRCSWWCSFPIGQDKEDHGVAAALRAPGPQPGGATRSGLWTPRPAAGGRAPWQSSAPAATLQPHGQSVGRPHFPERQKKWIQAEKYHLFLYRRSSFSSWVTIPRSCSTWQRNCQRTTSKSGRV